jgi:hypothetical protein
MMKVFYLIVVFITMLIWPLPAVGDGNEAGISGILYSIHYENGTVLNVTEDSKNFDALNSSTTKFLENIAYRMERDVTRGVLEEELVGTKYLVVISDKPMKIQTKPGLNPDWPQGWEIVTKKIVIKLQKEVLGEERIFTYHEPEDVGAPIRPWASLASVNTIIL